RARNGADSRAASGDATSFDFGMGALREPWERIRWILGDGEVTTRPRARQGEPEAAALCTARPRHTGGAGHRRHAGRAPTHERPDRCTSVPTDTRAPRVVWRTHRGACRLWRAIPRPTTTARCCGLRDPMTGVADASSL